MALTRTLAQLTAEILHRGDLRSVRANPNGTELTRDINASILKFWRLAAKLCPERFHSETPQAVAVVSGTASYALATDCFKVTGVDVQDGSYWHALRKFNFAERNSGQQGSAGKRDIRWRIMGTNLLLAPTPKFTGAIRVYYMPLPEELEDDADTFDGIAGYEEYVILDVILKHKSRDEDDYALTAGQIGAIEADMQATASDLDDAEPDRVRDVAEETGEGWYL